MVFWILKIIIIIIKTIERDEDKIKTGHTCSDVKATSLGTDDMPFSLTSGNIL